MTDYKDIFGSFAVADIDAARAFYEKTLELSVSDLEMGALQLDIGGKNILVYPKPDHQPAGFTVLNFLVDDIEATVDEFSNRGVEFIRYDDFPQDERGIMRGHGPNIAWFTDPSRNVMAVIEA